MLRRSHQMLILGGTVTFHDAALFMTLSTKGGHVDGRKLLRHLDRQVPSYRAQTPPSYGAPRPMTSGSMSRAWGRASGYGWSDPSANGGGALGADEYEALQRQAIWANAYDDAPPPPTPNQYVTRPVRRQLRVPVVEEVRVPVSTWSTMTEYEPREVQRTVMRPVQRTKQV